MSQNSDIPVLTAVETTPLNIPSSNDKHLTSTQVDESLVRMVKSSGNIFEILNTILLHPYLFDSAVKYNPVLQTREGVTEFSYLGLSMMGKYVEYASDEEKKAWVPQIPLSWIANHTEMEGHLMMGWRSEQLHRALRFGKLSDTVTKEMLTLSRNVSYILEHSPSERVLGICAGIIGISNSRKNINKFDYQHLESLLKNDACPSSVLRILFNKTVLNKNILIRHVNFPDDLLLEAIKKDQEYDESTGVVLNVVLGKPNISNRVLNMILNLKTLKPTSLNNIIFHKKLTLEQKATAVIGNYFEGDANLVETLHNDYMVRNSAGETGTSTHYDIYKAVLEQVIVLMMKEATKAGLDTGSLPLNWVVETLTTPTTEGYKYVTEYMAFKAMRLQTEGASSHV